MCCFYHRSNCANCHAVISSNRVFCSSNCENIKLKSLVGERIVGDIQEVFRFYTWWSKDNIATIITHWNSSYWVFLGVIDRKPNNIEKFQGKEIFIFPTNPTCNYWGEHSRKQHNYLSDARNEARWLTKELTREYGKYHENPILCIHLLANNWTSFSSLCQPYVIKDWNASISDFKPLDIAWVEKRWGMVEYYHVGVYLGNGKVCHLGEDNDGVKITDWDNFLKRSY